MRIISPDFENDGPIPSRFTCDGEDVNPELIIEDIPAGTRCMALIVDDPQAPGGVWDHWICYDIPVMSRIGWGQKPGKQGVNSFDNDGYGGPCPSFGEHRYVFHLYALDDETKLAYGATREEVENAVKGHIIEQCQITGRYSRQKTAASQKR